MSDTILVAALSLLGTLVGSFSGIIAANKLVNFRLQQLEQKVQAHNHLVERMYHLEGDVELVHEQMKVVNHRIGDLERFHLPG